MGLSDLDLNEPQVLITVVKNLMKDVALNKRKFLEITNDCELLKVENANLRTENANQIAIINATLGIETSVPQITQDSMQVPSQQTTQDPIQSEPIRDLIQSEPNPQQQITHPEPKPGNPETKTAYAFIGNNEPPC